MNSDPLVSVIVSTYNAMPYLPEALTSIREQTYRNLEIVVVNDGSSDDSREYLSSVDDDRLIVIDQPNSGCVSGWARAIASSSGPLLARMDSDDISEPRRIEEQVALITSNAHDIVGCWTNVFSDDLGVVYCHRPPRSTAGFRLRLRRENPLVHGSVLMRRDCYLRVGGYRPDSFPAEDLDLWTRMAADGASMSCVPEVLYRHRIHDSSVSSRHSDQQEALLRTHLEAVSRALVVDRSTLRAAAASDATTESSTEDRLNVLRDLVWFSTGRGEPWPRRLEALARAASRDPLRTMSLLRTYARGR